METLGGTDRRRSEMLNTPDVIDQVTAHCVELVVLFTNGAKQLNPPPNFIILIEPIRFGRTQQAVESWT